MKNLKITTLPFPRDSLFGQSESSRVRCGDNFQRLILPALPETIPSFDGEVGRICLAKEMSDKEIVAEVEQLSPFEPQAYVAVIWALAGRHSDDFLLTNSLANVAYVQLDLRILVPHMYKWKYQKSWALYVDEFGKTNWPPGRLVFFQV